MTNILGRAIEPGTTDRITNSATNTATTDLTGTTDLTTPATNPKGMITGTRGYAKPANTAEETMEPGTSTGTTSTTDRNQNQPATTVR